MSSVIAPLSPFLPEAPAAPFFPAVEDAVEEFAAILAMLTDPKDATPAAKDIADAFPQPAAFDPATPPALAFAFPRTSDDRSAPPPDVALDPAADLAPGLEPARKNTEDAHIVAVDDENPRQDEPERAPPLDYDALHLPRPPEALPPVIALAVLMAQSLAGFQENMSPDAPAMTTSVPQTPPDQRGPRERMALAMAPTSETSAKRISEPYAERSAPARQPLAPQDQRSRTPDVAALAAVPDEKTSLLRSGDIASPAEPVTDLSAIEAEPKSHVALKRETPKPEAQSSEVSEVRLQPAADARIAAPEDRENETPETPTVSADANLKDPPSSTEGRPHPETPLAVTRALHEAQTPPETPPSFAPRVEAPKPPRFHIQAETPSPEIVTEPSAAAPSVLRTAAAKPRAEEKQSGKAESAPADEAAASASPVPLPEPAPVHREEFPAPPASRDSAPIFAPANAPQIPSAITFPLHGAFAASGFERAANGQTPLPGDAAPPVKLHLPFSDAPDSAAALRAFALRIAAHSADGERNFAIRLDPPELGRIEVTLSVDASGHAEAELRADKPHTLEALQKEGPALERALKETGLNLSGGLAFSLRDESKSRSWRDAQAFSRSRILEIEEAGALRANAIETAHSGALNRAYQWGAERLDIRV